MADLHTRLVHAGERIFAEGDAADCAYVVESGEIEIHAMSAGVSRCVAVINAGNLLGEMAMLDDKPRSATALARSESLLTVIERSQLASRIGAADPVIRLLMQVLLNRLRSQTHQGSGEAPSMPEFAVMDRGAVIERIKLENELKAGLASNEMQLHVQPIADFKTRKIAGFESLVRWAHPTRGMIRPDHFIAVAEESGLIVDLGRWILRTACESALRFENDQSSLDLKGSNSFMSINVSGGQFEDPDFVPALADILRQTGVDPYRIKLEITESVLTDAAAAKRWIASVKSLGVRIALDDFGTGYSSLSYLHEFDLDTLKIDQSFVRRINTDPRCDRIVGAIITIAQALELEIIAEGIETEEHFTRLRDLGCQYAQGYLISKPVPVASFFS